MIIAVDGPVAAGKGTLARSLARELRLAYLDTGSIYRAVGAKILEADQDPGDPVAALSVAESLGPGDLERPDLRRESVGLAASTVAVNTQVRAALLEFQRDFAKNPPDLADGPAAGAVLDGRDIGTVVCPDADLKFFVTATPEARAERRHKELIERGDESIYARVLQDLKDRDARDSQRVTAPLKPAEDAVYLDTSTVEAGKVLETALDVIRSRGL
ncbi:(d)CMP kinase [Denitrobaculum tricleocarpae]|uniref:Cytidylate kinase n=1 Tax=Denitrobaculum tricleocarpae TaxID=2591009 RepID=A0A545TG60_9PROT|nr:d(CMP) kinase [Denitrobaculum tricleocarpae]TQV76209.1 (d)CMP kinase [Denitrobaculum tricleocarpae]